MSRSRDIPIAGAAHQPTRLRSEEFPAGLPGLRPHSQRKVELGNQMFCDSIEIAEQALEKEQAFLLENPWHSYGWLLPPA